MPQPPSALLPLTVTQCSPSVHPEALPSVLIHWAHALQGTFEQLQGLGSLCPFQPWLPVTLVSMAAMQTHPSYSGAAGFLSAALPIVLESCKEANLSGGRAFPGNLGRTFPVVVVVRLKAGKNFQSLESKMRFFTSQFIFSFPALLRDRTLNHNVDL